MRYFFNRLCVVCGICGVLCFSAPVCAQQLPVIVLTTVLPPNSPYISDYTTNNKLIIRLLNTSMNQIQARISGSIIGDNGIQVKIPETFKPQTPIIVPPGGSYQLSGIQLEEYFAPAALQYTGIKPSEIVLGNGLPEGTYRICVTAREFTTGQPLSTESCAPEFRVVQYEPPFLLQPSDKSTVEPQTPQVLLFSWSVPAGAPASKVRYLLRVVEVFPPRADPNQAMFAVTSPPLLEKTLSTNTYLYGPSDPPLERGKRYAFQVVAQNINGTFKELSFRNEGRSVPFSFTYGSTLPDPVAADGSATTSAAESKTAEAKYGVPLVKAVGVEANGVERSIIEIRVEEFLSDQMYPILPYVFFDENSADIPSRYNTLQSGQTELYTPKNLTGKDQLGVYYDVLNVIGFRLKNNPQETITIIGCNADKTNEQGNIALSKKRAESVQSYLSSVWNITPHRMTIEAKNLPQQASTSKVNPVASDEENRRVEILGSWNVQQPLELSDTLREATPPVVRFYTESPSSVRPLRWNVEAKQLARVLKNVKGNGPLLPFADWRINREKNSIPLDTIQMNYGLTIFYDSVTSVSSQPGKMPVQQVTIQRKKRIRQNDVEKDQFRLILFDFSSASLNEQHQMVLEKIKRSLKLRSEARLLITGHTDDLAGTPEVNERLSLQRAENVAKLLAIPKESVKGISVSGVGAKQFLFDTSLPEGRIFCRTVLIELESPVQYDR